MIIIEKTERAQKRSRKYMIIEYRQIYEVYSMFVKICQFDRIIQYIKVMKSLVIFSAVDNSLIS